MAETSKFGGGRAAQFGDRISPGGDGFDPGACNQCEAMLADALDGTLSPADLAVFNGHMAACAPCSAMLADAQRGAAWLEMLRDPRPEPPAELLERILAQTSGLTPQAAMAGAAMAQPTEAYAPGMPMRGKVLPFRTRIWDAVRESAVGQVMLQPRLAMTAAMAFFSVALTLNLTGIRLNELRASDLKPASIRRGFYSANARVVQYYEGLRVVYELESRVHDFETQSDTGAGTNVSPAPAPAPAAQPATGDPGTGGPGTDKTSRPAPGPGSSRRETPIPSAPVSSASTPGTRLVAQQQNSLWFQRSDAREEGALA